MISCDTYSLLIHLMLLTYYSINYMCVTCPLNNVHYFYQFRWRLFKKASQVLYLHFALKRREFLEEFHEKQEQVGYTIMINVDLLEVDVLYIG
jgi:hypothetical protein